MEVFRGLAPGHQSTFKRRYPLSLLHPQFTIIREVEVVVQALSFCCWRNGALKQLLATIKMGSRRRSNTNSTKILILLLSFLHHIQLPMKLWLFVLLLTLTPLAQCKTLTSTDSSSSSSSKELSLHYITAEEQEAGSVVANVSVDISALMTSSTMSDLRYQFLSPAPRGFAVGDVTGVIVTTEQLDRETYCLQQHVTSSGRSTFTRSVG